MQSPFLADLGPEAQGVLEAFSKATAADLGQAGAVLAIVTLLALVFACWIAAQIAVPDENATGGKVMQAGVKLFVSLLVIILIAGGAFLVATSQDSSTMVQASLGIGALLALYSAVSVPIKAFKIKAPKALGFSAMALVVAAAAVLFTIQMAGDALGIGPQAQMIGRLAMLAPAERGPVIKALTSRVQPPVAAQASPAPAAAPLQDPVIAKRLAELEKVHAALVARHAALKEGSPAAAFAAYQQESDRYVAQLNQLQKDYDAAKAAGKAKPAGK